MRPQSSTGLQVYPRKKLERLCVCVCVQFSDRVVGMTPQSIHYMLMQSFLDISKLKIIPDY